MKRGCPRHLNRREPHWSPAFLPIDPPLPLESGDRISLTLDRVPAGDWTWRIRSPRGSRRHSTLLGTPLVSGKLEKASRNYVPTATDALSARPSCWPRSTA